MSRCAVVGGWMWGREGGGDLQLVYVLPSAVSLVLLLLAAAAMTAGVSTHSAPRGALYTLPPPPPPPRGK